MARGANNVVQNNYIGVDATGAQPRPFRAGRADRGRAQHPLREQRRLGQRGDGVSITEATRAGIDAPVNKIGTNAAGDAPVPNGRYSMLLSYPAGEPERGFASDVLIGGTDAAQRNVISGNGGTGVYIAGGAAATASWATTSARTRRATCPSDNTLGNRADGVDIVSGADNRIGGPAAAEQNSIVSNRQPVWPCLKAAGASGRAATWSAQRHRV